MIILQTLLTYMKAEKQKGKKEILQSCKSKTQNEVVDTELIHHVKKVKFSW